MGDSNCMWNAKRMFNKQQIYHYNTGYTYVIQITDKEKRQYYRGNTLHTNWWQKWEVHKIKTKPQYRNHIFCINCGQKEHRIENIYIYIHNHTKCSVQDNHVSVFNLLGSTKPKVFEGKMTKTSVGMQQASPNKHRHQIRWQHNTGNTYYIQT